LTILSLVKKKKRRRSKKEITAKPTKNLQLYVDFLEKEVVDLHSAYNCRKCSRISLLNRLHLCEQDLSRVMRDVSSKEDAYAKAQGISEKLHKKLVEANATFAHIKNKRSMDECKVIIIIHNI